MIAVRTLFCSLAAFFALTLGAPALAGSSDGSSSRYLLIVDTSRSMRHRSKATLQTVHDLLSSGMQGELSGGETLGVWTFNQELYTGRFPLQVWAPGDQEAIARRALEFLNAQGSQGQPCLDRVIPAVEDVIKASERITVVLISAGDAEMRGTPFDGPINDYYARWYREQQKGQVPLVTVLRARNGKLIDWSVKPAAGPVDFPPWPPPEAAAIRIVAPAPAPASPPQAVQPRLAPPLILSGKRVERGSAEHGDCSDGLPAPALSAPALPAPALPAPALPAPTLPAPALSAPTLHAPTLPASTLHAPPDAVSHVSRARFWAGGVLAGGCCLAFGFFRLRSGREASHLSLITCSLDGGGNKPPRPALMTQEKGD